MVGNTSVVAGQSASVVSDGPSTERSAQPLRVSSPVTLDVAQSSGHSSSVSRASVSPGQSNPGISKNFGRTMKRVAPSRRLFSLGRSFVYPLLRHLLARSSGLSSSILALESFGQPARGVSRLRKPLESVHSAFDLNPASRSDVPHS